jgi:hypothetical protein
MNVAAIADMIGKTPQTVRRAIKTAGFELKKGKGGNDFNASQVKQIKAAMK